ncbi:MAG: 30S ribosomal protein S9 [Candidatus Krumholzibacteriota bacterium]|nr:30S ribosomal protein S9 [Candidatus Krumholzibacteriota bacterium]
MPDVYTATGRRKESVARVRIMAPGTGKQLVNGRPLDAYFGRRNLVIQVRQPLEYVDVMDSIDVEATVEGGGIAGQAGAVRLGIARALLHKDEELKKLLRSTGCLTRDPRMKERKKYGQPGARKRFQFSKR